MLSMPRLRAAPLLLLVVGAALLAAVPALAQLPPNAHAEHRNLLAAKLKGAVSGSGTVNVAPGGAEGAATGSCSWPTKQSHIVTHDEHNHDRRTLIETPLSPFLQPTTFIRLALLIIRNNALDNPAAGFLQSILTTELAYTRFSNVFASFAAAVVQDFSQVGSHPAPYRRALSFRPVTLTSITSPAVRESRFRGLGGVGGRQAEIETLLRVNEAPGFRLAPRGVEGRVPSSTRAAAWCHQRRGR